MNAYKTAIVTGGAGFIGSHIVERLVKMGVDTTSIDNYSAGKKENLAHLTAYPNFKEVKCDVLDYAALEELFPGTDVIFHQAASKKTICLRDPRMDLDVNAKGTFNLLDLAIKYGVKKFVHASTGSVYGEPRYVPQDEDHPLSPTSYYGVSKLAGERYVNVFNHLYGLDTTILRYFHVYGPRQESSEVGGVVSIFARNILEGKPIYIHGDGTQQRSFTYVEDVVSANISAATGTGVSGEVFNCASGISVTITDLYERLCTLLCSPSHPLVYDGWLPGDIKKFSISNDKIRMMLGMEFAHSFNCGLEQTAAWAKKTFGGKGLS